MGAGRVASHGLQLNLNLVLPQADLPSHCIPHAQNPAEKVADVALDVLRVGAGTLAAGAMIPARQIGKVLRLIGEAAGEARDKVKGAAAGGGGGAEAKGAAGTRDGA